MLNSYKILSQFHVVECLLDRGRVERLLGISPFKDSSRRERLHHRPCQHVAVCQQGGVIANCFPGKKPSGGVPTLKSFWLDIARVFYQPRCFHRRHGILVVLINTFNFDPDSMAHCCLAWHILFDHNILVAAESDGERRDT